VVLTETPPNACRPPYPSRTTPPEPDCNPSTPLAGRRVIDAVAEITAIRSRPVAANQPFRNFMVSHRDRAEPERNRTTDGRTGELKDEFRVGGDAALSIREGQVTRPFALNRGVCR